MKRGQKIEVPVARTIVSRTRATQKLPGARYAQGLTLVQGRYDVFESAQAAPGVASGGLDDALQCAGLQLDVVAAKTAFVVDECALQEGHDLVCRQGLQAEDSESRE